MGLHLQNLRVPVALAVLLVDIKVINLMNLIPEGWVELLMFFKILFNNFFHLLSSIYLNLFIAVTNIGLLVGNNSLHKLIYWNHLVDLVAYYKERVLVQLIVEF